MEGFMSKQDKKHRGKKPLNFTQVVGKHSNGMVSYGAKGRRPNKLRVLPEGFYVFAWRNHGTGKGSEWVAICPCFPDHPDHMRFLRLEDAQRAADALIAAGLNTCAKLAKARPELIRKIACELLAW